MLYIYVYKSDTSSQIQIFPFLKGPNCAINQRKGQISYRTDIKWPVLSHVKHSRIYAQMLEYRVLGTARRR